LRDPGDQDSPPPPQGVLAGAVSCCSLSRARQPMNSVYSSLVDVSNETSTSPKHPLLEAAFAIHGDLVDLRRAVHAAPELGFEEFATRDLAREALVRAAPGVTFREVAKSGLVATLPGDGPDVVIRACLDALPITEQGEADYRSARPGASHACGHDGQIAVLVGAVRLLAERPVKARVHALFQPAEEIDKGARAVIADGLLEDLHPGLILGFHGHPGLAAGQIGVKSGPVMGSITTIQGDIIGREGHGAEPHLTADAVTAAAALVVDWQVALGRRIDPRQPVVLSVGRLVAGVTANVVPGRAELEATLRSLDPAIEEDLRRIVFDVARGVEVRSGVVIELSLDRVVPAVVNAAGPSALVAEAARSVLGPAGLVEAQPTLGGDDFAWYLQVVPGCYFFIGERREDRPTYGWHDPAYDLDESSLAYGSAVLAEAVIRFSTGGLAASVR
jgi:amidohydrolase